MVTYLYNHDLFSSSCQTLVNTVNCVGVMGKGLALQFKSRYPREYFSAYQRECTSGRLTTSHPTLYRLSPERFVLNFATKRDWRAPSQLEWIESGLRYLVAHYEQAGITSLAFPKLGCANGGLSWSIVGPLMARYLGELPIPVEIYLQSGDQEF